ncbi:MAG: nucleotidyltransferase [Gemmatimonadetes bacterium]|nr:nucleotidyltransferase [Gemmatimonadota bacterium]MYD27997.1 nucleotidyltransferase [Dehalococcoidia bacterium]MYI65285.1 nucleotidyltransferase [Gemmatimonadota bacterium]
MVSSGGTSLQTQITHRDVAAFAENTVNLHRGDVAAHRAQVNRLREQLEKHIAETPEAPLMKMLLSGSLAKGTALSTLNDIDVAVYVWGDAAPTDDGELLDWLADLLRAAYPNHAPDQIRVHPGSHCVTVSFRGSGLDVDVVPVLYYGDEDDRGFLVTKDSGERVLTSIPLHLQFLRRRKDRDQHCAQIIRLVKWWARRQKAEREGFKCKSFIIELICAKLVDDGIDFSNYPRALEEFFAYVAKSGLQERIAFTDHYDETELPQATGSPIEIFDPVNPQNNVASRYEVGDRDLLVSAARDALDALTEAHYSDTRGRALDAWRDVLGPSFRGTA